MSSETVRRGRPPLIGMDELQRRALSVIARDGYNEVTMGQVAQEIGVSLRTLHRHFPTKADLVWGALEDTFAKLSKNLAAAHQQPSVIAAIAAAIVASFSENIGDDGTGRERLRLIATTPALQAAKSELFRGWQEQLVHFAAIRLGVSTEDVAPLAIATAAQSATMAGLSWWATHDDGHQPAEIVARALRALDADGGTAS